VVGVPTATVLDARGLAALDPEQWRRLSDGALAENPYYSRQHLIGTLETIARGSTVSALAIRAASGELSALLPFRARAYSPFPWRVAEAADSAYQSSSTPLLAAAGARPALDTWLATLGRNGLPAFWTFADIDTQSPFTQLLADSAAAAGCEVHEVAAYSRPRLTRLEGGLEAHLSAAISGSRRKRLNRNLRRLRALGELRFERARSSVALRRRLEEFLALEHNGWKGRRGTSLLARDDTAAFARRVYGGCEGREGLAFIDTLLLDGRPIAMALNVASGRIAYSPKSAYDESLRSYSPGLVLDYLAIEKFYAEPGFDAIDAATTVEGHVLGELWNERRPMARLVVGPADLRTGLLAGGLERLHQVRVAAKRSLAPGAVAGLSLMRRVAGSLWGLGAAAFLALPQLLISLKRHEWAVASLAAL
jgi:CelD/BcsL family acetyltransferase involved in cellulose biosynthesis